MQITHKVQLEILRRLLFHPESRFSDLNTIGLSNDHFNFHVKRLLKLEIITKKNDLYSLSDKGMRFARKLDTTKGKLIVKPKVTVAVLVERNNNREILLLRRKRNPYNEMTGLPTEKVHFGESMFQVAKHCLEHETGLCSNSFKFRGLVRKIHKNENPAFDRILNFIEVLNYSGEINEGIEGTPYWVKWEDAYNEKKIFYNFPEVLDFLKSGEFFFKEWMLDEDI